MKKKIKKLLKPLLFIAGCALAGLAYFLERGVTVHAVRSSFS